MNERIRELAEQAKEHADTYDDLGTPVWFQFYNAKFAELIVRECAQYTGGKPNYVTEPEITHAFGCWSWGPGHYLCALNHIRELPKQLPKQYSYYEYIKENSYSYIKRDMNGVVTTVWAFDTGDGTDMYDMEKALEAATKSK